LELSARRHESEGHDGFGGVRRSLVGCAREKKEKREGAEGRVSPRTSRRMASKNGDRAVGARSAAPGATAGKKEKRLGM